MIHPKGLVNKKLYSDSDDDDGDDDDNDAYIDNFY